MEMQRSLEIVRIDKKLTMDENILKEIFRFQFLCNQLKKYQEKKMRKFHKGTDHRHNGTLK